MCQPAKKRRKGVPVIQKRMGIQTPLLALRLISVNGQQTVPIQKRKILRKEKMYDKEYPRKLAPGMK
jgi:hypothetical protein